MTTRNDFDRQLAAWFEASAPSSEPEPLLGQVLARTARTRRRPAWRIAERWIPMSAITTRSEAVNQIPWRTVGLIALLVLALVGGAMLVAGARKPALPPPFGAAANGRLVYSVGGDIVVADDLSSTPRTIVQGPSADSGPLFSPDGTRFVFVRGDMASDAAQLWVANADGTDPRELAPTPRIGWAEWSPRSDIVAVLQDGDPSAIRLVDVKAAQVTRIDTGLGSLESVIWRPTDGRQLTFRGKDDQGFWGIYLMDRSGGPARRLALDPGYDADPNFDVDFNDYFLGPTWTADGARLVYYSLEPHPGSAAGPGYRVHVATIDADGSVTKDEAHVFVAANEDEFLPIVLPDGDTAVFQSKNGIAVRMNIGSLTGRIATRPLDLSSDDYWVPGVLSPDGRQIISRLPLSIGGTEKRTWVTDLTTFTSRSIDVGGDDLNWQRRAP